MNATFLINTAFIGYQAIQYKIISDDPKKSENYHRVTLLFIAVNTTWLVWNQGALLRTFSKSKNWVLLTATCGAAGITYLYAGRNKSYLYEGEDILQSQPQHVLRVRWSPPPKEKILKGLFVAQGIQTVALLCFGKNKLFSLIHLVGITAALYESSKKPWLEIFFKSLRVIFPAACCVKK